MYDGYLLSILHGALLSIQVALGALVVAIVLGLAGATAKLSSHNVYNWIKIEVNRNLGTVTFS